MKTAKTTHQTSNPIDSKPLNETNRQLSKYFNLPILLGVVMITSLGFATQPVRAENTGAENAHPGYRYIKPKGVDSTTGSAGQGTKDSSTATDTGTKKTNPAEQAKKPNEDASEVTADLSAKDSSTEKSEGAKKTTSDDQNAQIDQKAEPVAKPKDGKGAFPTFSQADINGDHYITKDELENYPYLLQVFDQIDAGKDGKLEQHEYQNLEMETKRESQSQ